MCEQMRDDYFCRTVELSSNMEKSAPDFFSCTRHARCNPKYLFNISLLLVGSFIGMHAIHVQGFAHITSSLGRCSEKSVNQFLWQIHAANAASELPIDSSGHQKGNKVNQRKNRFTSAQVSKKNNPLVYTPQQKAQTFQELSETTSYNSLSVEQLKSLTNFFCDTRHIQLGHLTPAHLHDMHRLQIAWAKAVEQQPQQQSSKQPYGSRQKRGLQTQAASSIDALLQRALDDLACFWSPLLVPQEDLGNRKKRMRLARNQRLLQLMHTVAITALIRTDNQIERAADLLERMQSTSYSLPIRDGTDDKLKESSISKLRIVPDNVCFLTVIDGWAKEASHSHAYTINRNRKFLFSRNPKRRERGLYAAAQAQRTLDQMIHHAMNATSFVMDSADNIKQHTLGPSRIISISQGTSYTSQFNNDIIDVMPNSRAFNLVMNAWAENGCGAEAENLLRRMSEFHEEVSRPYWATMQEVDETNRGDSDLLCQPDMFTYNTALKAYSKSVRRDSAQKAKALLDEIEAMSNERTQKVGRGIQPDRITYTTMIDALAHAAAAGIDTDLKAEDVLKKLEDRYRVTGDPSLKPDTVAYNHVLNAISKTVETGLSSETEKKLLFQEDCPGERCEKLVGRMEQLYASGQNADVRPDTYSYNIVINTWANTSLRTDAAERAEAILVQMEHLADLRNEKRVAPNTVTYNSVIKAWSRNTEDPRAPLKAESILRRMKARRDVTCAPDTVSYNSVLYAWANSDLPEAQYKVKETFDYLTKSFENDVDGESTRPDLTSYNTVLNFWARNRSDNSAPQALALLEAMRQLSKNPKYKDLAPDTRSYTAVMNCISKSRDLPRKAYRAKRVLEQLEEAHESNNGGFSTVAPNVYIYSTLINACAFSSTEDEAERREAMDIAIETMAKVAKSRFASANHVIYGTFLKACSLLMDPKRDYRRRPLVEQIFRKSCKDGQVGSTVLEQLYFAAGDPNMNGLYEELVGDILEKHGRVAIDTIPLEWKRNVRENPKHWHQQIKLRHHDVR